MKTKQYEIVIFGASSFVGKIICEYMLQQFPAEDLSFAMAGRSEDKLLELKKNLGKKAKDIPLIIADANNLEQLKTMCDQAKVIMSTVGPYDLYGETLIQACVETGTDYCDLTGEPHWIKKMLIAYEQQAKKSGARIVHCTGFDSIPSDLGVYYTQREAKKIFGTNCSNIKMRIKNMRGAASGGTIATALNIAKELKKDPEVRRDMINPYSLCPKNHGFKVRQKPIKLEYDETFKTWIGPFFMSSINTRIVHRSNALNEKSYGENFHYSEGVMTGKGIKGKTKARGIYWGLAAFFTGAGIAPIRAFLGRFVLTKPGQGPSKKDQENGFYDFRFVGTTEDGQQIQTKVYGDMDPGYGSTAKIMSQAAACLAQDVSADVAGGFWTPATVLSDKLIDRLNNYSGVTFEVLES
ncbi:MAG: trans-acting enoyl reductase family protein [Marinicellaceae bacterium]